jgi:hypothetical protein
MTVPFLEEPGSQIRMIRGLTIAAERESGNSHFASGDEYAVSARGRCLGCSSRALHRAWIGEVRSVAAGRASNSPKPDAIVRSWWQ